MPKLIQHLHPACFDALFPGVARPVVRVNPKAPQYAMGLCDFMFDGEQYSAIDSFVQANPNTLLSSAHHCGHCGEGFQVGERGLTVSWKPRPGSVPRPRLMPKIIFTREDGSIYDPEKEEK